MHTVQKLSPLFTAAVLAAATATAGARNPEDLGYLQMNLAANSAAFHPKIVDEHLIDALGIALAPTGTGGHIAVANAARLAGWILPDVLQPAA